MAPVHAWVVARDDAEVVAAFERLHLIRSHNWPMVAAWLLDSGFDGSALAALAALDSHADAWDVDPLRGEALREVRAPAVDDDRAALLLGATLAQGTGVPGRDHPAVRLLAAVAPSLNYPAGLIGESYYLEEFLDCDCHPDRKREADRLEHDLRTRVRIDLNPGLAAALRS